MYFPDESYFLGANLSSLYCESGYGTINTGGVLLPSGSSCDDTTNPIRCTQSGNNTIEIKKFARFTVSDELAYKCCLPDECGANGTGIITANIFGK